jgi:2,3-bisphosphoglycerate-independent phosphoglycerate mutase
MKHTVVLVVLDGWGIGQDDQSNPIHAVKPKTIEYLKHNFPSGALQSAGMSVGLPWKEEGNSEVGHLTMGIGRIMYQHYPRISLAIQNGTFQKSDAISNAFNHALLNKSRLHLVGLVGQANIHSSLEHLKELIAMAIQKQVPYVLHLFTDGRDSDPHASFQTLSQFPIDHIGSISGRYYAMDRDKHWDLTQRAYQAITGTASYIPAADMQKHIEEAYAKKLNDEFVLPVGIGSQENALHDNDAVLFFNFREDRMRQLAESFTNPYFTQFPVQKFTNVYFASMTLLREDFTIPVAFPPEKIEGCLGKVLAENNKTQLRIAETQKYAHVTFFFNGLNDKPFPNEYRVLIPSKMIPRQEDDPIMQAPSITTRLIQAIEEETFDFILVNYANPDMIAHTGNYDASEKAIRIIDEELAKVVTTVLKRDTTLIVTSDHGNVERLFNPATGEPETKHDANPVPIYLVGKQFYRPVNEQLIHEREHMTVGLLADIAPTVLELLNIQKPKYMTGESLLKQLLYG